ncbi:hypothetical protein CBS101457_001534 [Exobasidium rhododendri]|nr:hypothetical protein CBS101457_001534 [Exobasidium rhododendri]
MGDKVLIERQYKPVYVVTINRPKVRNAVDGETAQLLHQAFIEFAEDDEFSVAILRGSGGNFCAGADLRAISNDKSASGLDTPVNANPLSSDMNSPGPMGPTRLALCKPVIACIEGYAVAGGLELAAWSDLRVASADAKLGVLCRLRGVPLIDGGTYRLPKLLGLSRAQDLMLTGRLVDAQEGEKMGLLNIVVNAKEDVFEAALKVARLLCQHPQQCMRGDHLSARSLPFNHGSQVGTGRWNVQGEERKAMQLEFEHGRNSLLHLGQALEDFLSKKSARL